MTSTSPISAGIFLMVIMSKVCTLIAISLTLRSLRWAVTSTSDSISDSGWRRKFSVRGLPPTDTFLLIVW